MQYNIKFNIHFAKVTIFLRKYQFFILKNVIYRFCTSVIRLLNMGLDTIFCIGKFDNLACLRVDLRVFCT